MAAEESLGEIYVKISADVASLEKDVRAIKQKLDKEIPKAKIDFDTSLGKLKISEMEKYHKKLQSVFEKKLAMNADIESIRRTGSQLKQVESILNDVKLKAKDSGEELSRWGMIATGIQSFTSTMQNFSAEIKRLIGNSVVAAANLNVLRASFKGSAEDLDLLRQSVTGSLSEGILIALSNKATKLGLSIKEQAIAFAFAENAADSLGGSIEDNFLKIVNASEGMGRGLKEIGVQTKVYSENLKILEKQTGKKLADLDAEEQKTIMLKATIQSLGLTIEDVLAKTKDEGDLMTAYGISLDEARIRMGNLILKGLIPLLKSFDKSDSSIKNFIASIVAIGGTIIQFIPMVMQLYTAKKLFASASLMSTSAVNLETTAINSNTAAKVANSKVSLGLIGKVGAIAAVGVAVWQLTEFINENTKAIKANREEADKKFPDWDKSGFGPRSAADQTQNKKGDQGLGWLNKHLEFTQKLNDGVVKQSKKTSMSVEDVRQRIIALTKANDDVNITWQEFYKNLKEINELQKRLGLPKEKLPYFKPGDVESKNLMQQKGKVKSLKEVKVGAPPELPQSKLQPYYDMLADGGPFAGENLFVNTVETSMATASGFVDGFFEDLRISSEGANSILEKGFVGMANAFIAQVQRMIAEWLALQAIRAGLSFLGIPIPAGAEGGTFIGTNRGVKKYGSGGSFIVPPGYSNDNYPMFVKTGEKVNVTPANRVGEQERLLNALVKRMDVMNWHMIETSMKPNRGTLDLSISGEFDGRDIHLANKKEDKIMRRIS